MAVITWIGILVCLSQSAIFSGMNLAVFSLSRMRLEVEAADGNLDAKRLLALRNDPNFILTTILWGNVGINVLLTLLTDSVMTGVSAFLFSTIAITLFGEIGPQAYFSRNAMRMASLLSPLLRFYQILLYPVAKTSALLLDYWLGKESAHYYRESHLKEVLRRHMEAENSDLGAVEAIGALNMLTIDDLPISSEGRSLEPLSIIPLEFVDGVARFPQIQAEKEDPFLLQVEASGHRWVVFVDQSGQPQLVLDSDGFLRHILFHPERTDPLPFCHRPIIVHDHFHSLGEAMTQLTFTAEVGDHILAQDIILLWDE
ncbi:MAG: DUF21 domain-containing protein, partial [Gammaproteobacteria bacterium]|nr:DUF21 domain-containing protein [Gammaproteobacteria bacterium]